MLDSELALDAALFELVKDDPVLAGCCYYHYYYYDYHPATATATATTTTTTFTLLLLLPLLLLLLVLLLRRRILLLLLVAFMAMVVLIGLMFSNQSLSSPLCSLLHKKCLRLHEYRRVPRLLFCVGKPARSILPLYFLLASLWTCPVNVFPAGAFCFPRNILSTVFAPCRLIA